MTRPIVAVGILLILVSLTIGVSWQNYDPNSSATQVDDGGYSTMVIPREGGTIPEPIRDGGDTYIMAVASTGYVFEKWTVQESDGSETDYSTNTTIKVDMNHAIYKANFRQIDGTDDRIVPKFYSWNCPVFANGSIQSYEGRMFTMDMSDLDYSQARSSSTQRRASSSVTMPVDLIKADDPYIQRIAAYLSDECQGMNDIQRAYTVLCFVQDSITYRYDILQYGTNEYWALPVETLYTQYGDCEDTAILMCSIASAMGINSALVGMQTATGGHMGAAIAIPLGTVEGATFIGDDGREYAYCETASDVDRTNGEEWMIGKLSSKYSLGTATIILIEPQGGLL